MSKLGNRFGLDVEKLRIRSFEYGGKTFHVRVPLMGEFKAYEEKIEAEKQNKEAINAIYLGRAKDLAASEDVQILDDDIVVKGRSVREGSMYEHLGRVRITWAFNLLVKEVDDGLGDLTFEDISAELPVDIQLAIVDLVFKAIYLNVEEAKKKSIEIPPSNLDSTLKPMAQIPIT